MDHNKGQIIQLMEKPMSYIGCDCIRVQEEAFRKIPTDGAIRRPRIDMYFPCEREDGYFRWGSMEGANDELGLGRIMPTE